MWIPHDRKCLTFSPRPNNTHLHPGYSTSTFQLDPSTLHTRPKGKKTWNFTELIIRWIRCSLKCIGNSSLLDLLFFALFCDSESLVSRRVLRNFCFFLPFVQFQFFFSFFLLALHFCSRLDANRKTIISLYFSACVSFCSDSSWV